MSLHPVDADRAERATVGQRVAEAMAARVGSWAFIIGQNVIMLGWIVLNAAALVLRWDPYPFILLNLMLSMQAAETGPILLLAANRSAERDRALARHTYEIDANTLELLRENTRLTEAIHGLTAELHAALTQPR